MPIRFRPWKTLPPGHKDYFVVYIWGILWSVSYLLFAPPVTYELLDRSIVLLWVAAASVGAILALIGLVTRDNLLIERLGVTLLMIAPIVYTVTQLGLFLSTAIDPSLLAPGASPNDRIYLILLGFWPFWWLNKRRHQLKQQVLEAKATPTPHEESQYGIKTEGDSK